MDIIALPADPFQSKHFKLPLFPYFPAFVIFSLKRGSLRYKALVIFRRSASGEVIGEIANEAGEIVEMRNFGHMTDKEIERVLEAFQAENPDTVIRPVRLTDKAAARHNLYALIRLNQSKPVACAG